MQEPAMPQARRPPGAFLQTPTSESPESSSGTITPTPTRPAPSSRPPSRTSTPPPRGRGLSRYPSNLGRGSKHVPLHRRGTSRTYERLEDLLAEAGYKETRVFTPEAERVRSQAEKDGAAGSAGKAGGVGAVVGFLAGLMPGAAKSGDAAPPPSAPSSPQVSASPFASKAPAKFADAAQFSSPVPSPSGSGSTLDSSGTPSHSSPTSPRSFVRHQIPSYNYPARPTHIFERTHTHPEPLNRIDPDGVSPPPQTPVVRPRPPNQGLSYSEASQARRHLRNAELRHMASVPNLSEQRRRAIRTPGGPQRAASSRVPARPLVVLNSDGDSDPDARPPLPRTWLETVAKAVLGSGPGAHAGRPAPRPASTKRKHGLSADRSPSTDTGRAGRALAGRHFAPPPQRYLQRAPSVPGEVSTARVVCRSAPTSRASSRVRGGTFARLRGQRGKAKGRPRVPVLALTSVEGGTDADWGDASADEPETTEDEGELDLAQMLVPAKRQNSIRSLRRHLDLERGRGTPPPPSPLSAGARTRSNGPPTRHASAAQLRLRRPEMPARRSSLRYETPAVSDAESDDVYGQRWRSRGQTWSRRESMDGDDWQQFAGPSDRFARRNELPRNWSGVTASDA